MRSSGADINNSAPDLKVYSNKLPDLKEYANSAPDFKKNDDNAHILEEYGINT